MVKGTGVRVQHCFLVSKTYKVQCKCLYYSQSFWGNFFSCNGRKMKISEEYTCLCHFLCIRMETESCFNTSDLLPNISLVVRQSSVNISRHMDLDLWMDLQLWDCFRIFLKNN